MRNHYVSVGLFVVGGLILFGLGLFLIGDRRQAFGEHAEYYSEFANLAGLSNGAKVRVGGMDAGEVLGIDVPNSPTSRFRVKWRITANLRALVRNDSLVSIDTEGVVGGTYLAVRPGTTRTAQAARLATIPSKEPAELAELLARGTGLLDEAQSVLKNVGGKLGNTLDTVNTTVANVNEIATGLRQGRGAAGMLLSDQTVASQLRQTLLSSSQSVDELLAGLKAGRGPAGLLLRDEAVAGQLREALRNVQQASADIGHATHQADAIISDLAAQQVPQKAGVIADNVADSTTQLHQLFSELSQPDRQGVSAGANIRDSFMNANAATSNLADGSEALKHNFLLRGFFKRRGYYNLDRISAEQYRRDKAFISPTNHRAWLPAGELFQDGANNQEELSAAGKSRLDGVLSANGESVFEGAIVIEGYSSGRPAADQLRLSHSRAILVRQYIQSRFQLDSNNLGVVALKNSPPAGIDHAGWDGVCVVLLKQK